jgi:hypothetical protein
MVVPDGGKESNDKVKFCHECGQMIRGPTWKFSPNPLGILIGAALLTFIFVYPWIIVYRLNPTQEVLLTLAEANRVCPTSPYSCSNSIPVLFYAGLLASFLIIIFSIFHRDRKIIGF